MSDNSLHHVLKHDIIVEMQSAIAFIQYILQDIDNHEPIENIQENLEILYKNVEKMTQRIEQLKKCDNLDS